MRGTSGAERRGERGCLARRARGNRLTGVASRAQLWLVSLATEEGRVITPPSNRPQLHEAWGVGYLLGTLGAVYGAAGVSPDGSRRIFAVASLLTSLILIPIGYYRTSDGGRRFLYFIACSLVVASLLLSFWPSGTASDKPIAGSVAPTGSSGTSAKKSVPTYGGDWRSNSGEPNAGTARLVSALQAFLVRNMHHRVRLTVLFAEGTNGVTVEYGESLQGSKLTVQFAGPCSKTEPNFCPTLNLFITSGPGYKYGPIEDDGGVFASLRGTYEVLAQIPGHDGISGIKVEPIGV